MTGSSTFFEEIFAVKLVGENIINRWLWKKEIYLPRRQALSSEVSAIYVVGRFAMIVLEVHVGIYKHFPSSFEPSLTPTT